MTGLINVERALEIALHTVRTHPEQEVSAICDFLERVQADNRLCDAILLIHKEALRVKAERTEIGDIRPNCRQNPIVLMRDTGGFYTVIEHPQAPLVTHFSGWSQAEAIASFKATVAVQSTPKEAV